MRESFGSAFMYNLIIIFLLVVFAFIMGTVSYYKAFKVNAIIINAIEKYEGYNSLAVTEIDRLLNTIGYRSETDFTCPTRDGVKPLPILKGTYHKYCVYQYNAGDNYRQYGVVTYMNIELPIIGEFLRVPVFSKTMRLYNFG